MIVRKVRTSKALIQHQENLLYLYVRMKRFPSLHTFAYMCAHYHECYENNKRCERKIFSRLSVVTYPFLRIEDISW